MGYNSLYCMLSMRSLWQEVYSRFLLAPSSASSYCPVMTAPEGSLLAITIHSGAHYSDTHCWIEGQSPLFLICVRPRVTGIQSGTFPASLPVLPPQSKSALHLWFNLDRSFLVSLWLWTSLDLTKPSIIQAAFLSSHRVGDLYLLFYEQERVFYVLWVRLFVAYPFLHVFWFLTH